MINESEGFNREQAEWKAPEEPLKTHVSGEFKAASKSPEQSSFDQWSRLNGVVTDVEITEGMDPAEKEKIYDTAFREGQKKLMGELRDPNNNEVRLVDKLDLPNLKAEITSLREKGDIQALAAREIEIANSFQQAISKYPYDMGTCHMAEILSKKKMNCVGASTLGGALLDEVGINYLVGHIGDHVLLVVVASDGKVLWQDMQDGLERPGFENEELTTEKIQGSTPSDIAAFAKKPGNEGLKFFVKKEYWKNLPMTVWAPNVGLELQELISTGFVLGNNNRNDEALEILELAKLKSPNDVDVHQGLARAYKNKKMYKEAVNAYQKAVEIDPDNLYLKGELDKVKNLLSAAKFEK